MPALAKGPSALAERVLKGDTAALSRALTIITEEDEGASELSKAFFAGHGRAHKVGLCGSPGSGKSSLVNRLVSRLRKAGEKVGVLAVDPTSPFTGGAFLGDRLRVQEHALDGGVFMRSLATRGMLGGLSGTIFGAVHALEAYGCDRILIETVGTGQDEVDIADAADTVLCVTAPNQGDEFQAMKAGMMEIADIFAVNKADLPEADKAVAALRDALGLGPQEAAGWKPQVHAVSAATSEGVDALGKAIDAHRDFLKATPEGERRLRRQLKKELSLFVTRRLYQDTMSRVSEAHIDLLRARKTDPAALGKKLLGARR